MPHQPPLERANVGNFVAAAAQNARLASAASLALANRSIPSASARPARSHHNSPYWLVKSGCLGLRISRPPTSPRRTAVLYQHSGSTECLAATARKIGIAI